MKSEFASKLRPVVIRWLIILGIFAILFFLLATRIGLNARVLRNFRKAKAKTTEIALLTAMQNYSTEYGFPVTGNPSQILDGLRGNNQRKIVFFETGTSGVSAQGEIIDPWGTPYRIDLSNPDAPRVWSCGPNRQDEAGAPGSDDIVSWR